MYQRLAFPSSVSLSRQDFYTSPPPPKPSKSKLTNAKNITPNVPTQTTSASPPTHHPGAAMHLDGITPMNDQTPPGCNAGGIAHASTRPQPISMLMALQTPDASLTKSPIEEVFSDLQNDCAPATSSVKSTGAPHHLVRKTPPRTFLDQEQGTGPVLLQEVETNKLINVGLDNTCIGSSCQSASGGGGGGDPSSSAASTHAAGPEPATTQEPHLSDALDDLQHQTLQDTRAQHQFLHDKSSESNNHISSKTNDDKHHNNDDNGKHGNAHGTKHGAGYSPVLTSVEGYNHKTDNSSMPQKRQKVQDSSARAAAPNDFTSQPPPVEVLSSPLNGNLPTPPASDSISEPLEFSEAMPPALTDETVGQSVVGNTPKLTPGSQATLRRSTRPRQQKRPRPQSTAVVSDDSDGDGDNDGTGDSYSIASYDGRDDVDGSVGDPEDDPVASTHELYIPRKSDMAALLHVVMFRNETLRNGRTIISFEFEGACERGKSNDMPTTSRPRATPAKRRTGGTRGPPFTREEDDYLKELKAKDLKWKQIQEEFASKFPNSPRSSGCLQVRFSTKFSTKLKDKKAKANGKADELDE